jgi:hypothetical protein
MQASLNRIRQHAQRGFYASLLLSALAFGTAGSAQASLLGLTLQDSPDIVVSGITTTYVAGTDLFTATSIGPMELDDGSGPSLGIDNELFTLDAVIDNFGNLSSGTFSIEGDGLGFATNNLLTGTLTAFGSDTRFDPFEFLFTVTSGELASLYGAPAIGTGGIILNLHGFNNDWNADFGATRANADIGVSVVPVPAAVWLFGSALFGLVGYGRHTKRKQAAA